MFKINPEYDVADDDSVDYVSRRMANRASSKSSQVNHPTKYVHVESIQGSSEQRARPNIFFGSEENVSRIDKDYPALTKRVPALSQVAFNRRAVLNTEAQKINLEYQSYPQPGKPLKSLVTEPNSSALNSSRGVPQPHKMPIQSMNIINLQRTISNILDQKAQRTSVSGFASTQRQSSSARLVKRLTSSVIKDPFDESADVPEQRPGNILQAISALEDAKKRKGGEMNADMLGPSGISFSMQALEILSQEVDQAKREQEELEKDLLLIREASRSKTTFSTGYLRELSNLSSELYRKRTQLLNDITGIENKTEKIIEDNSQMLLINKHLETKRNKLALKKVVIVGQQEDHLRTMSEIGRLRASLSSQQGRDQELTQAVELALMKVSVSCLADSDHLATRAIVLEKQLLLS